MEEVTTLDDFVVWGHKNGSESTTSLVFGLIFSEASLQFILVNLYGFLLQVFILPFVGYFLYVTLIYGAAVAIFKYRSRTSGYSRVDIDEVKETICNWWTRVGKTWFGYETVGMENIPVDEPVMFVMYHGSMPADLPFLAVNLIRYRKKNVFIVRKSLLTKIQAICRIFDMFHMGPWNKAECVEALQEGHDLIVSPGAALEVRFGDEEYRLNWGRRNGFAKVAVEAKVPIVPVFCRNQQEAFWMPFFVRPFLRGKYSPKEVNFVINGGGLPVKLTTIFGRPIPYNETVTANELAVKTKNALQQLIDDNQRLPGSKLKACLDRYSKFAWKTAEYVEDKATETIEIKEENEGDSNILKVDNESNKDYEMNGDNDEIVQIVSGEQDSVSDGIPNRNVPREVVLQGYTEEQNIA